MSLVSIIMSRDILQENAFNSARVKIRKICAETNLNNKVNALMPQKIGTQKIDESIPYIYFWDGHSRLFALG